MLRSHCSTAGHLVLLTLLTQAPAVAATFTVTKTADTRDGACDADCSLREAVLAANASPGTDTISLGEGIHRLTRAGTGEDLGSTGDLDVLDPLILLGTGAGQTFLDGGAIDRVLDVGADVSLELRGVTVKGGAPSLTAPGSGNGGGIRALGPLMLADCVISGNTGESGGGVFSLLSLAVRGTTFFENRGVDGGGLFAAFSLRLDNVTFAGNRANLGAGAYLAPVESTFHVRQTTVAGNEATAYGGGLYMEAPTCPAGQASCGPETLLQVDLSIVAGNSAPQGADCFGLNHAGHANVFSDPDFCFPNSGDLTGTSAVPLDPKLAFLSDVGGPTPTRLPLEGSPAIDVAPASACTGGEGVDQRGRLRPVDGDGDGVAECDAGAVEVDSGCEPGDTALCLGVDGRFRVIAHWATQATSADAHAFPLTRDTGSFWFFDADNLELLIKVLDGCAINDRFWVFQAGLTDVGVEIIVNDTLTGRSWSSSNPRGVPFQTRLDTSALDACQEP